MDDSPASSPDPYEKLTVRSQDVFPLVCTRCQRRFTDLSDFIARTSPIFQSSGLLENEDPATGPFVLLLRNCLCGTSLALRCNDRRNQSAQGRRRRDRFSALVNLLVESGVSAAEADREVRRLLQNAKA